MNDEILTIVHNITCCKNLSWSFSVLKIAPLESDSYNISMFFPPGFPFDPIKVVNVIGGAALSSRYMAHLG